MIDLPGLRRAVMITLHIDFSKDKPHEQVVVGAPYQQLADVLSSDFRSVRSVVELIENLRGVVAGSAVPEDHVGNAYAIRGAVDVTVIEGLYGEPPVRVEVPTSAFIELLARWESYVRAAYPD